MPDSRWRRATTTGQYLVVVVLAAFTVGVEWGDRAGLLLDLGLCATVAIWMLAFRRLTTEHDAHPTAVAFFLSGLVLLMLALVLRHGWFGFLAITCFTFAYGIVPWPWQLLPVAAVAVVAGIAQSSSFTRDSAFGVAATAAVIMLNVVVMCGLSWGLRVAQRDDEKAGVDAERARLAREIHDTLAQNFAGIVTQLQAAEQAADDGARIRHTEAAIGLARDGLAQARRSVQALRPAELEGAALPEAIGAVARRWSARTGIRVEIHAEGAHRVLATDAEVALLRTTQEALANVERHAGATHVEVSIRYDARGAAVEVRDDGRGFDPAVTDTARGDAEGGYGLIGMRERIEAVAGDLVVESEPGRGTAVRVEVPA